MTFYVLSRRIFLAFYFYIFTVTGTTNIKTQCDGKVSGELNITCVVDPQLSFVSITLPDGTNAASCTAPLPGIPTNCPQLGPYVTVPTTVGTVTTFILKIPSLDISTHEGNWTCHHSVDSSAGKVCVNAPLFSQGKEPTFTATYTSNSITFSGEAYCQHPVSAVKIELLHAEENGAFTTLTPQPSISIQNFGSNGCGSQESNVSFSGILSCDDYTLAGKTFTLMARFTQSNLPTDSNTYNVTSSGSFSCPDAETTTVTNVETTTTSQTTTELVTTSTEPQTSQQETTDSVTTNTKAKTTRSYSETTTKPTTSTTELTTTPEAASSSGGTTTGYTSTTNPSKSPVPGEEIIIIVICSVVGFIIIVFIFILAMFVIYKKHKNQKEKQHKREHKREFELHKHQEKTFDDIHAWDNWNKYDIRREKEERHIAQNRYPNKKIMESCSYTTYQRPREYDHNKYIGLNTISSYYPRIYGDSHKYGFDMDTSPYGQNYQYFVERTHGSSCYEHQKLGRSGGCHHGRSGGRHHGRYQGTQYQSYPAAFDYY